MTMSRIKEIRKLLNLKQHELAEELGCAQTNVSHYEKGQMLPPDRALALIDVAAKKKLRLTLDQVYGRSPLPRAKSPEAKVA